MDAPALLGDALAQPTRAKLFALLGELKRRAGTEELADRLGLHANGVRRQLERLAEAGLVTRARVVRGRGRPRDEWSIAPGAEPGGERPHAYNELAVWLARATPPGPGRLREIERAGREIGREVTPAEAEGAAGFEAALAALGFQPELETDGAGRTRCRLCNCPYRDSVRENAEVICTLHRGMTAGMLSRLSPGARLIAFEPHDPDLAGCLIEADGLEPAGELEGKVR